MTLKELLSQTNTAPSAIGLFDVNSNEQLGKFVDETALKITEMLYEYGDCQVSVYTDSHPETGACVIRLFTAAGEAEDEETEKEEAGEPETESEETE